MKRILLLTGVLFPVFLFGQTGNYVIQGKVSGYNKPAKVYLLYKEGGQSVNDSTVLKNGSFEFKGSVASPVPATILLDGSGKGLGNLTAESKPDALSIYIEKGTIRVDGKDSIARASVSGSVLNQENQQLMASLKGVEDQMNALNSEWQSASAEQKTSGEFKASLEKKYEGIQAQQKKIFSDFIKGHQNSYISLNLLRAMSAESLEYSEINPLFSALSPALKGTPAGKSLAAALESAKKTAIGSSALDFTQNDVNGKPVSLSDFRGKYVLLDFWASWCGPCRQENPNVVRVFNKYKDRNFTILSVSLDRPNGKDAWLKAIQDDQLTWTHVSDLKFWSNKVAVLYGVQSIPQNFLLDPSGKIIAKNLRGEELDRKLAEVIK